MLQETEKSIVDVLVRPSFQLVDCPFMDVIFPKTILLFPFVYQKRKGERYFSFDEISGFLWPSARVTVRSATKLDFPLFPTARKVLRSDEFEQARYT